jgi:hypothetical protein
MLINISYIIISLCRKVEYYIKMEAQFMKRKISLVLVLAMMFSLCTFSASALAIPAKNSSQLAEKQVSPLSTTSWSISSATLSTSFIEKGYPIYITVSVSGGSGYTYSLYVIDTNTEQTIQWPTTYQSSNRISYTPTYASTYEFIAVVKDSSGATKSEIATTSAYDPYVTVFD